jgi:hypothetical protein
MNISNRKASPDMKSDEAFLPYAPDQLYPSQLTQSDEPVSRKAHKEKCTQRAPRYYFETFAFLSVFFARKNSFGVPTKNLKEQQPGSPAYPLFLLL